MRNPERGIALAWPAFRFESRAPGPGPGKCNESCAEVVVKQCNYAGVKWPGNALEGKPSCLIERPR